MSKRERYQQALSSIDRDTRICILQLENAIDEIRKEILVRTSQSEPKPDLSVIETKLDSLQKQIDGLRPKVEKADELVRSHDNQEPYLKNLAKTVLELTNEAKKYYELMYESGQFKEGVRIKLRDEKLIKKAKDSSVS